MPNDSVLFDLAGGPLSAHCVRREGIDLVLNSRVASVAANKVAVVNSQTNETSEIPFGACVWATGVAMHPLIKQLQVRVPTFL